MKPEITKHHRCPRSRHGSDEEKNISLVPKTQHQAWHTLFGNMTPEQITKRINDVWIDPSYRVSIEKR